MTRYQLIKLLMVKRIIGLLIVVSALLLLQIDLAAKEVIPNFDFNSESIYWPTNSWKHSEPEDQGMDSKLLYQMLKQKSACSKQKSIFPIKECDCSIQ